MAGDLIAYGAAPSAMEAHDFRKGLGIDLLKGGKRGGKKTKSVKTLKDSVMSVGVTTLKINEEDKEMENGEDNDFGYKSVFSRSTEESKVGKVQEGDQMDESSDEEKGGEKEEEEDGKF